MQTVLLWLIALSLFQQSRPGPMTRPQPGVWSARAAYAWPGLTAIADFPTGGRAIDVPSPDGSRVISIGDSYLIVRVASHPRRTIGSRIKIEDLLEVLWAPDSRAFAVTQSDGGWVGTWHVAVFQISSEALNRVSVSEQVFLDFSRRRVRRLGNGCTSEEPNIGAVTWLNGSSRLILLAEAPPHSSDCDMGRVHGYMVDVPTGAVLAQYSVEDVRRLFGSSLGGRLR